MCRARLQETANLHQSRDTDLHVGGLCLGDGAVKVAAGGESSGQALVDSTQLLCEDMDVVLQALLLLLLLLNLPVQLFSLGTQLLNTLGGRTFITNILQK